ncbi:MAG: hypothetical protein BroJett003_19970 [Planctomycetota bacterium]|nr:MAG: hypothetical protein BroJett003_19970 [Planctomycetota bacterium]
MTQSLSPTPRRRMSWLAKGLLGLALLSAAGVAVLGVFIWWYAFRVEVAEDELLVLIRKSGKTVPTGLGQDFDDQVILYDQLVDAIARKTGETPDEVREGYQGIRLNVLTAGRYFPNPYTYERRVIKTTVIGPNEVGVLVRRYGRPLEFPKTVATEEDERGPVAAVLEPGRHDINLLANEVQRFEMILVPEGHCGVVTLLSGDDPATPNTYTVEPGEKGVQRQTLPPGRHPYNPYLQKIDLVDLRSHKYDMLGDEAIYFPSNDSFEIELHGYIEWAIRPDRAAEVTVAYGDEDDILNKVVLPYVRSISRIQGSRMRTRDFIGKTRTTFQEHLLTELKKACWREGVDLKAVAITEVKIPSEIASLISAREQADQEIERSKNQIEEARAEVRLVEERERQDQNKQTGEARRGVVTVTKRSEQQKVVQVTQAERELEVARLNLEAAEKLASATRAKGRAEANVVLFDYQARAEPLKMAVAAFGDGETYAQQFFLQKIAPAIQSILSNTEGPFADIFKQFQVFPGAASPASTASKGGSE